MWLQAKTTVFLLIPLVENPSEDAGAQHLFRAFVDWVGLSGDHRQAFDLSLSVGRPGEAFMEAGVLKHLFM